MCHLHQRKKDIPYHELSYIERQLVDAARKARIGSGISLAFDADQLGEPLTVAVSTSASSEALICKRLVGVNLIRRVVIFGDGFWPQAAFKAALVDRAVPACDSLHKPEIEFLLARADGPLVVQRWDLDQIVACDWNPQGAAELLMVVA